MITWKKVDHARFWEMLGAVPPAIRTGTGFLVGEAYDHNAKGEPRYRAFACIGGDQHDEESAFYEASHAMTIEEFRAIAPAAVLGALA